MSVRNALLGLLSQRPRHGYELLQAFETMAGGREVWEVKPAQVYTTLARLKENGLIVEVPSGDENGNERQMYALTPAGRDELKSWFEQPVRSERQRDEFFIKLMLAVATGYVDPREVIYAQRSSLYQELHDLTERRMTLDPRRDLAHILLLDQAIMHIEADLRWMDMIEARLDEVARQPLPEPEMRPRGRPPGKRAG
ncbi:MAG TPA: PadR family transcriptional regulator [Anaerolinea thermolimosa]|uniref:PadR family transcriptional regulator n=1 Tax=Anaerolinea thermolimosa TaxID=229919 RepID=A0A3D1JDN4_9CHLR|nr:helix-turn-helix transcriptional regulator [Anaerolinea thermolimosa]GAP07570.1 predicted transcriptional regulators [Anaerolinea thermolimosa]HCE16701.1 PadR family transcriptional regulator [Anaerolinea thermolimosa]